MATIFAYIFFHTYLILMKLVSSAFKKKKSHSKQWSDEKVMSKISYSLRNPIRSWPELGRNQGWLLAAGTWPTSQRYSLLLKCLSHITVFFAHVIRVT